MTRFRRIDPPDILELRLTPRQRQVLRLLFRLGSRKEVANFLGLSDTTIRKTLIDAYARLGVENHIEAAYRLWLRERWGEG